MIRTLMIIVTFFPATSAILLPADQSSTASSQDICSVFMEATEVSEDASIRHKYIAEHLEARSQSSDLADAYDVIYHVDPEKRYTVFSQAVESVTGEKWECPQFKLMTLPDQSADY